MQTSMDFVRMYFTQPKMIMQTSMEFVRMYSTQPKMIMKTSMDFVRMYSTQPKMIMQTSMDFVRMYFLSPSSYPIHTVLLYSRTKGVKQKYLLYISLNGSVQTILTTAMFKYTIHNWLTGGESISPPLQYTISQLAHQW